jgi:hypothetical protein
LASPSARAQLLDLRFSNASSTTGQRRYVTQAVALAPSDSRRPQDARGTRGRSRSPRRCARSAAPSGSPPRSPQIDGARLREIGSSTRARRLPGASDRGARRAHAPLPSAFSIIDAVRARRGRRRAVGEVEAEADARDQTSWWGVENGLGPSAQRVQALRARARLEAEVACGEVDVNCGRPSGAERVRSTSSLRHGRQHLREARCGCWAGDRPSWSAAPCSCASHSAPLGRGSLCRNTRRLRAALARGRTRDRPRGARCPRRELRRAAVRVSSISRTATFLRAATADRASRRLEPRAATSRVGARRSPPLASISNGASAPASSRRVRTWRSAWCPHAQRLRPSPSCGGPARA